jgi:hypothetical protein
MYQTRRFYDSVKLYEVTFIAIQGRPLPYRPIMKALTLLRHCLNNELTEKRYLY